MPSSMRPSTPAVMASQKLCTYSARARARSSAYTASAASWLPAFAYAEDSVFFGRSEAFRGKAVVVASWEQLFEGPQAPFWKRSRC